MKRHAAFALAVVVAAAILGTTAVRRGDSNDTLADAVAEGDQSRARNLLSDGADPDHPRVLGLTPLMRAALRNDAGMTRLLLDAGADIAARDTGGLTAAHIAAEGNAAESLRALAAAGADIHSPSRSHMNVIQHAAARGSVDVIREFAAQFDLDEPSGFSTGGHGAPRVIGIGTLGLATLNGHAGAAEVLLELGADVNAPSSSGPTPLLIAIFTRQKPHLVALLLAHGADPTIVAKCNLGCSGDGGDAIHWAQVLNRTDLLPLLGGS